MNTGLTYHKAVPHTRTRQTRGACTHDGQPCARSVWGGHRECLHALALSLASTCGKPSPVSSVVPMVVPAALVPASRRICVLAPRAILEGGTTTRGNSPAHGASTRQPDSSYAVPIGLSTILTPVTDPNEVPAQAARIWGIWTRTASSLTCFGSDGRPVR